MVLSLSVCVCVHALILFQGDLSIPGNIDDGHTWGGVLLVYLVRVRDGASGTHTDN